MKRIGLILSVAVLVTIIVVGYFVFVQYRNSVVSPDSNSTPTQQTPRAQTYRNTEFGFEFQYPRDWTFEINSFYSPASKFNLQGNSSAKNYNALIPPFLINIVTPKFADNAVANRQRRNAVESKIFIDGIEGTRFEYMSTYGSKISIDIPLGEHRMIIAAYKAYEDTFNQILNSFSFFEIDPHIGSAQQTDKIYASCDGSKYAKNSSYTILIEPSNAVGIIVTDPEGYTITPDTFLQTPYEYLTEVPGQWYNSVVEINEDGRPVRITYSPNLKRGEYLLRIVPEEGASAELKFNLDIGLPNTCIRIAENTTVADIPEGGYKLNLFDINQAKR